MKYLFLIFTFLLFPITLNAMDLGSYKWQNRVLLIFAQNENTQNFLLQESLIESSHEGFDARDMAQVTVFSGGADFEMFDEFNLAEGDFAVILIGKDGGEKARWMTPVEMINVFRIIDQMPMRQREMEERGE